MPSQRLDTSEMEQVKLSHVKWLRSEPGGVRANLPWANLSGANLSGANLSGANLSGADLYGADLSGADLSGADLSGANLSWANLSWANLSGANLSGANLSGANLSGANLSGADLYGANLSGANLYGHKVNGSVITGHARGYEWLVATVEKGTLVRFGCEAKLWSEWDLEATCERHEPGRGFPATIKAIVALHAASQEPKENQPCQVSA